MNTNNAAFICCGIIAGERLLLAQGQGFDHPFAMGSNYVWFTFDGGKDTFNGKIYEKEDFLAKIMVIWKPREIIYTIYNM